MAIQRHVYLAFRRNDKAVIRAISADYGYRELEFAVNGHPSPAGDWANYIGAAVHATARFWKLEYGINVAVCSDLPPAAGLSSSSALLTGLTLALLQANEVEPTLQQLMDALPGGEQFVGTRGGAMDHAAVLAGRTGSALLVRFAPLEVCPIPIPADWSFLIAHSLVTAEKSGAVRKKYNACRTAGANTLQKLGFRSYLEAIDYAPFADLSALSIRQFRKSLLDDMELRCFQHVISEGLRVRSAIAALRGNDAVCFGNLMSVSHASLRNGLGVSCPSLDELVNIALDAGALGTRLTGAGFGGCAIVLAKSSETDSLRQKLIDRFYSKRPCFDPASHLITAEASAGALYE